MAQSGLPVTATSIAWPPPCSGRQGCASGGNFTPGEGDATWGVAVDCDNNTITWYCQGNVITQVQNTAIEDGVQYIPCMQFYSQN